MVKFLLTEAIIEKARKYLTIAEKEAFAERNATLCFDTLQIKTNGDVMPPMYKENAAKKQRVLMGALVNAYLGLNAETQDGGDMLTEEAYDRFGESHIFTQIERMKRRTEDSDIRDAIFELMSDYFQLDKILSCEIHGLLDAQNDIVTRQQQATDAAMKQLPQAIEALKALQEGKK